MCFALWVSRVLEMSRHWGGQPELAGAGGSVTSSQFRDAMEARAVWNRSLESSRVTPGM